ncbi:solute carrier family 22 member 9-like [Pollicipes pollicipes]|uniref:solute carrier family 22 member 9-like n=1 Tax=Pollicipes pollicipes TaxID=41117 RepID=UPI001884D7DF|nr:solute carrier family 22 member 9-like [Pollicipes pollicipes]
MVCTEACNEGTIAKVDEQVLLVLATSFAAFSAAINTFSLVFKMDEPAYWCVRDDTNRTLLCRPGAPDCAAHRCHVPVANGTHGTCVEWTYDRSVYASTVVTDFDLVCGRTALRSFTVSLAMLSGLAGAFVFGLMGDRYGRARACAVSTLLFALVAPLVAAATDLATFLVATSVSGFAHVGMYICFFTLCMESIAERRRAIAGIFWVLPWALGIMATALVRLLLGSSRMATLSLTTAWLWLAMAVVYYGISFDSAQLAADAYLAMCLAGLVELPKCTIGAGFGVIYVYIEETMPTEVRSAALGMSTMAEALGGALSPHVAYGLGALHWLVPSVTFGVLAVSAGVLVLLVMPETAGQPLPTTVAELLGDPVTGGQLGCWMSQHLE